MKLCIDKIIKGFQLICFIFMLASSNIVFGQSKRSSAESESPWKGVWKSVSYGADLEFKDVVFVSPDVGWVAGAAGTLLKTTDGGDTWTAQLGGDPESKEKPIERLFFVDETHGWAEVDGGKLLRTTDGETWEEYGRIGEEYGMFYDFLFTSEQVGVQIVKEGDYIARTQDGGRSWQRVTQGCQAKVEQDGLVANLGCRLKSLFFINPEVGYAAGATYTVGMGGGGAIAIVLKTTDGGETWEQTSTIPNLHGDEGYFNQHIFFIDENTGFLVLTRSDKLMLTTDGGQTWRGLVGPVKEKVRFADPQVGWSFDDYYGTLAYTVDGGKRWTSRQVKFPAEPKAFSFPRRDRAYVVGKHGMIFRYRVVEKSYTSSKRLIAAPLMPPFEIPVEDEVESLEKEVSRLSESLSGKTPAGGGAVSPGAKRLESLPEGGSYVDACCKEEVEKIEANLISLATEVPEMLTRYRNLNLVMLGLKLITEGPARIQTLQSALSGLRGAKDAQSALSSLTELTSALGDFKATMRQFSLSQPGEN